MGGGNARAVTVDPVTFEILRHRVWMINDEQSRVVVRTSGSPVAYEAKDLSTAILGRDGSSLFISPYMPSLAMSLNLLTRAAIEAYGDDIVPGDMFFSNDPWQGAAHQNDQAVVAPAFVDGRVVCWTGVALHDSDVGAPEAGINPRARDAHSEAPIIPVIKIVDRGRLRPDLETWIHRNVRDPELNALNLRARIAAVTNACERMRELANEYGNDVIVDFQRDLVDTIASAIRERLRNLPDATWTDELLLDHDGRDPRALFRVALSLKKVGDRLTLDFSGTDPQAAGPINCAPGGLFGGVYGAIMPALCFDIGWCPAAVAQVIEVISEDGTLNNARYPAAVGFATVAAIAVTRELTWSCISRLFSASPRYRHRARAHSSITATGGLLWGVDRTGRMRTTQPSFLLARGSGASARRDGVDTGGNSGSPGMSIFNVETAELSNPFVLVLYRRQAPETAGAGTHRGGLGMELGLTARGGPLYLNWGSMGFHHPQPKGLEGGEPSSVSGVLVLRRTDLAEQLANQRIPLNSAALSAERTDVLEAKCVGVEMAAGDVLVAWGEGGGGYGDPLDRAPELIDRDLRQGLCTVEIAQARYGVVLEPSGVIDRAATSVRRDQLRRQRLARVPARDATAAARTLDGPVVHEVSSALDLLASGRLRCRRCRHDLGPKEADPTASALSAELPLRELSTYNRYAFDSGQVLLREFFCPGCGTRIDMRLRGADVLADRATTPAESPSEAVATHRV
jgi:N-methylhydantoinase B